MNIRWLSEVGRPDSATVGGKGANLGELTRLGMPVPPGFIVTTTAYAEHASRCGLNEALRPLLVRQDWAVAEETALEILRKGTLVEALSLELLEAYREMGAPPVAVRSSATAEDLAEASFAGQQETFLDVQGHEALTGAIRKCWASLWSRRALHYRHHRSIDQFSVEMAVVVQKMVAAEASGVLFTVDPVLQRSDRMLIELAAEAGGVVSGFLTGQSCRVDRESLTVTDRRGKGDLLNGAHVEELCRLALWVEEHFGCPQDIEFALSGGKLHLLQTRPITSLTDSIAEPVPPLGAPSLIDKAMKPIVDERYVIAPRPLDNITYTRCVGAAIYMLRQGGGVVTPEDEAAFRSQLWRQAYRLPPMHGVWRILLNSVIRPLQLLSTDWQAWWESGAGDAVRGVSEPVNLEALVDSELLERADRILQVWEDPLNRRFDAAGAIQAEPWLRLMVTLAVGRRMGEQVLGNLMAGIANPTVELNRELWELSRLARREPSVLAAVGELVPERLSGTPEGRAFGEAFESFINKYGHRESSCWYLSTPTWRRDPLQVWRLLASLVKAEAGPGNPEEALRRYQESRADVERRLRFYPGLPGLFRWMVDRLRRLHGFRESSHFDLSRALDALQQIAAEWGRRLTDRGLLGTVDDVYYLTHDEVRRWLNGKSPDAAAIHELLARRRATYRKVDACWQEGRSTEPGEGGVWKGIAVSPGVARGKVRVLRGEHELDRLRPGEVLVCSYTNPAWTPLFASASAVVTETGGAASHAAIVAREYGIPAVMAVQGVTHVVEDGQEVLVDGSRGIVRCIDAPSPP